MMVLIYLLAAATYITLLGATAQYGGIPLHAATGFGTLAVIFILVGVVGDSLHEKKVEEGKAEYRLPFWKRWAGWEIGYQKPPDGIEGRLVTNTKYYDPISRKLIPIHMWYEAALADDAEIRRLKRERAPGWSNR